ncbi:cell wall hydrolase [Tsuneonella sp. HG222]
MRIGLPLGELARWMLSHLRVTRPLALLPVAVFSTGILVGSGTSGMEPLPISAKSLKNLEVMTEGRQVELVAIGGEARERNGAISFTNLPLERVAGFNFIRPTDANYPVALKCLSQAVYYEAANESRAGKLAVAQVVLNRVRHPAYPKSVCGVVYEGWNKPVCQFSFTCDGSLLRTAAGPMWRESQAVAAAALSGATESSVGSATNYHADYVVPRWAFTLAKIDQIGAHIFYRFPNRYGGAGVLNGRWNGNEALPLIGRDWLESRIDGAETEGGEQVVAELRGHVPAAITDRHADHDIGGRLDPAKTWRLTIPDPVRASSSLDSLVAQQRADAAAAEGAGS